MSTVEKKGLGERIGDIVREGNARHIIAEKEGRRLVDLPLTVIVISVILAPWLVAILAAIAVIAGYSIRMETPTPSTAGGANDNPLEPPGAGAGQSGPGKGGHTG